LIALRNAIDALTDQIKPAISAAGNAALSQSLVELEAATADYCAEAGAFDNDVKSCNNFWQGVTPTNALLLAAGNKFRSLAEHSRDLIKDADQLYKLASRLVDDHEQSVRESGNPANRELSRSRKAAEESRKALVEALKKVRHCWKAAHWLQERFPSAELRDIPGLVKRVSLAEIASSDWSLAPSRYVGVAPEEQEDDFDFEQSLRDIHIELRGLNDEAKTLVDKISRNFEELGA
jgi:type I restriction enzyme M protein